MRRLFLLAPLLVPASLAAQTAHQEIRIAINAVNAILIHGASMLTIPAQRVGAAPVVSRTSATYAVTTNEMNRRIMVSIDAPMPVGTSLTITMAAPRGGSAIESVPLSTSPQTAVTGISQLNQRDLSIEYALTAAPGSTVTAAATRTVSLTMVSGV